LLLQEHVAVVVEHDGDYGYDERIATKRAEPRSVRWDEAGRANGSKFSETIMPPPEEVAHLAC
jgi:hypothetical protein